MTPFDHPLPHRTAIAVAPNGGRRTRADHPAIPLTAAEIARTAAECADVGASMIHVHVRDADGRHLLDADAYRAAIAAIRAETGDRMVVQITTESLGIYRPSEQAGIVKAVRPEAASLALREFVPDENVEVEFADLLTWMGRENVVPQIILYEPSDAVLLENLIGRGIVPWKDIPVLYVLGRYSVCQTSEPPDLLPFLAHGMPQFGNWSVCAFGNREAACVTAGALLGGNARVGFENNLFLPDGSLAPSNAALVEIVAKSTRSLGLEIYDADAIRHVQAAASRG